MYLFPHVCKVWGMISIRRLYFDKKVLKRQIQSIVMFGSFGCVCFTYDVLWQKQHQCEKSVRKITQQNVWLDYKFLGKEPQPIKTERGKWSHHAKLQIFCDEKQEKTNESMNLQLALGLLLRQVAVRQRGHVCFSIRGDGGDRCNIVWTNEQSFQSKYSWSEDKTEKAISDDMTYVCSSERQF